MSRIKENVNEIIAEYKSSGHVYSDNITGTKRILIEGCNADRETKQKIRDSIIKKIGNCEVYIV